MLATAQVIFGWSNLSYSSAGTASLNISSTVNRVPVGYEEVIAAANTAHVTKELTVFYDGANLKDFLKDQPAKTSFIASLLSTLKDPSYAKANQWITTNDVTGTVQKPTIADVEKRLAMPGVDNTWAMPYFLQKSTFTDERGSHVLFYEDSQSIAKKIWLAMYYKLNGVSLWYMGNYTAADWELVGEQGVR